MFCNERQKWWGREVDLDGRTSRDELGGVEEMEIVIGIYCVMLGKLISIKETKKNVKKT